MTAIGGKSFVCVGIKLTCISIVKLTLPLADSLCAKRSRATKGVSETKPAFEQLTECLDASLVREWTEQERVAMEQRGDHLKIYEVVAKKCKRCLNSSSDTDRLCLSVPTLAEIRLTLSVTEVQHGNLSGSVSTITEGLAIEKSQ